MGRLILCVLFVVVVLSALPLLGQDFPVVDAHHGRFANAAERILNDPECDLNSPDVQRAIIADVKEKREADRPKAGVAGAKVKSATVAPKSASGVVKPRVRHGHSHPQPLPPIYAYQMQWARMGYGLAATPRVYVGPVVWIGR